MTEAWTEESGFFNGYEFVKDSAELRRVPGSRAYITDRANCIAFPEEILSQRQVAAQPEE